MIVSVVGLHLDNVKKKKSEKGNGYLVFLKLVALD